MTDTSVRASDALSLPVPEATIRSVALHKENVLVTGGTGFIGSRLAQRLAVEQGANVTAAGRDLQRAAWLEKSGVTLQYLEVTDTANLAAIVRGQDIVYHLAVASGTSKPEWAHRVNVVAVENLVRAAAAAGVQHVVHVSSMAVYGAPDSTIVTEDQGVKVDQVALYGRTKAQGETAALELGSDLGVAVSVIRPGMVFGPRGRSWTINLVKLIKRGIPVVIGDGSGFAQPVYVDNLIDGMFLVAERNEAKGEAFNFVDQPLPWSDFLAYYGRMVGRKPRHMPLFLGKALLTLARLILRRSEPVDELLAFYTMRSRYSTEKAEQKLGYRRAIGLEEGMRRTHDWLIEAGYVPAPRAR